MTSKDLNLARLAAKYRPSEVVAPLIDAYVAAAVDPSSPAGKRALRGVPVVGGVSGTIVGTDPLRAMLDAYCACGAEKLPDRTLCRRCARIAS